MVKFEALAVVKADDVIGISALACAGLRVAANVLNWQFNLAAPNRAYVSDITYIRTATGLLAKLQVLAAILNRLIRLGAPTTVAMR